MKSEALLGECAFDFGGKCAWMHSNISRGGLIGWFYYILYANVTNFKLLFNRVIGFRTKV